MITLQKQIKEPVHGMTPMYYIHMNQNSQSAFNYLLSLTNVGIAQPFIESVLEIIEFIEKHYVRLENNHLTPEERSIILDRNFVLNISNAYKNSLRFSKEELVDTLESMILSLSVDHDIKIGSSSLNQLLTLSRSGMDSKLNAELSKFSKINFQTSTLERIEATDQLETLSESANIAQELIERRINRLSSREDKGTYNMTLNSVFNALRVSVEDIDMFFFGEDEFGVRDEERFTLIEDYRNKLGQLGVHTATSLGKGFSANKSFILSLSENKRYRNTLVPILEGQKQALDIFRTEVFTKLKSIRDSQEIDIFCF